MQKQAVILLVEPERIWKNALVDPWYQKRISLKIQRIKNDFDTLANRDRVGEDPIRNCG